MIRRRAAGGLAALALALAAGIATAADCGSALPKPARLLAQADGWQLAFAPRPSPVSVGQHFALDIVVCPPPGRPVPLALRVDAEMPAHRHGMNYRATTQSLGGGRFRAEGLMFHMPGTWRFMFDLEGTGATAVRLTKDVDLK